MKFFLFEIVIEFPCLSFFITHCYFDMMNCKSLQVAIVRELRSSFLLIITKVESKYHFLEITKVLLNPFHSYEEPLLVLLLEEKLVIYGFLAVNYVHGSRMYKAEQHIKVNQVVNCHI